MIIVVIIISNWINYCWSKLGVWGESKCIVWICRIKFIEIIEFSVSLALIFL